MPFLCFRSEKGLQAGNTRNMASATATSAATCATSVGVSAAASLVGKGGQHGSAAGAALESPRDVLDGPAWSEYQSELLEDLQQPAGGMSSTYPALLPLDIDTYSPLNCSTMDCAAPYFDAEGCLQQHDRQQLPNLGLGLGMGMPSSAMGLGLGLGLGVATTTTSMPLPPPSPSCSVDLRGIKVTNKEVIQNAMDVLGVNGLLQFVELWDRSRRRIQEEHQHQQQQQQQQQSATSSASSSVAWDLHHIPPPWPVGHPLPDGIQLLPPLLPFGGLEEPAFNFGDAHSPPLGVFDPQQQQQQQATTPPPAEDDKSYVLLNFPANKCLRLSSPPSSAPTAGDLPDHRAAKFVSTTSFAPLTSRTSSANLPTSVPLELLAPCLVPPLQQQQQPDVPSFVPVAQTGSGIVNSGYEDNLQQQLHSRRTRLQQQQHEQQQQQQQQMVQQPVKSSPAATTRAARKHRMARQRHSHSFLHHHHLRGSSNSAATTSPAVSGNAASASTASEHRAPSQASNASSVTQVRQAVPAPSRAEARSVQSKHGRNMDGLQFLFQKELKPSDVGSLGRIILPKREAESQLPALNMKDGMPIHAEDFDTGKTWTLKYRFWPNNKSRMYVLECTGEFVKMNRLEEGDLMILYRCTSGRSKYVLRGKKQNQGSEVITSVDYSSEGSTKLQQNDISREGDSACTTTRSGSAVNMPSSMKKCAGGARETGALGKSKSAAIPDPTLIRSGPEDEFLQELTEDSSFEWGGLATLERFPSLEAGDMSLDDILGLGEHSPKRT